ncbi:MAG: hypothetical protein SFX19_10425 [Alphaproteobacteria bacterium]|nr:hypothetical protein [Alphaproteobacteria bacterium]
MIDSLGTSLAGLQNASSRVAKAAQNIADSGTIGADGQLSVEPTEDIVDLSIAAQDFKFNAKAIEIQNKTQQYLLNIIA